MQVLWKKIKKQKVMLIFIYIFILSIIAFSITAYIDWSLMTGYLVGTVFSIISYFINQYFSTQLLSKRRTFKFSFFVSILKNLLWMAIFCGIFIGILFANNLMRQTWETGIFNIFTFIYGAIMIPTSIIVSNFINSVEWKKSKKEE